MHQYQYDIYGVGNAIVDFDFEISDATLQRLGIEKGVTTTIDEARSKFLMQELDGIKHVKACGGSVANTLMTMRQLGGKCFYSCRVANDSCGDFFYEDLLRSGIDTNLPKHDRVHGETGKCIAMITPDAERTMNTFLGVSVNLAPKDVVENAICVSNYLYIEGYLMAAERGFEAAKYAKQIALKNRNKIALTLSDVNIIRYFRNNIDTILEGGIDILFCNELEASFFTETSELYRAAEKLGAISQLVVITRGDQGAILYDHKQYVEIPAYPVIAIDSIGAGDVFAGAFLYAITHHFSLHSAADFACLAASYVVTRFGPRLANSDIIKLRQSMDRFAKSNESLEIKYTERE